MLTGVYFLMLIRQMAKRGFFAVGPILAATAGPARRSNNSGRGAPPRVFMKKALLTLLISLIGVTYASAQRSQTVSLRAGQQKSLARNVKIQFLEVVEDSRCPEGTECIWAGNAKVKMAVSRGKIKAEEIEINSGMEPTTVEAAGYRFEFGSLTRRPTQAGQMTMVRPKLVLKVTRLKR